jgi:glyoxylase-like metal-dependent hydrolase (beta-lactamase superfamily II)
MKYCIYREYKNGRSCLIVNSKHGITPLRLEMNVNGTPFVVYASVIWDENEVILVDTGIPGQLELIRNTMEMESLPYDKLTKIVITHQDRDHIGSLPELVNAFAGQVEVFAHEVAVPYLMGEIPLIKSGAIAPAVKVDRTLQDGDVLPYGGGTRILFTPGHTPDHISLYHEPTKTLISGDALTSQDGLLLSPAREFTPDWNSAIASVSKLQELDIETVITYHGGICTERIQERLVEIIRGMKSF